MEVVQGETFNPMFPPTPWGIVEIVANMLMGHPDRKLLRPWQGTENLIDRALDIALKAFGQERIR